MRPTLPAGISVGSLPEISAANSITSDFELYDLRVAPGSPTHLLLLPEQTPTSQVANWLASQPKTIVIAWEIVESRTNPAKMTGFSLVLNGVQLSKQRLMDESAAKLDRLFLAMVNAADACADRQMFPWFDPHLSWQNNGELATLLPSKIVWRTDQERVCGIAQAFYVAVTGIDSGKKIAPLNRWARYANERLSTIVDRCTQRGPLAVSSTAEIRELMSGRSEVRSSQSINVKSKGGLDSVAGMQSLKALLLEEVVKPIRDPEPYRQYGLTIPNGILLFGPPGCGKTYIARQLADELGHYFVEIIPSELASPFVHQTVLKIRETFDLAAEHAPSVLFIDEFDALVPARADLGGHQQYKSEEVNEFLSHLNECAKKNIFVIAATNEPQKIDAAVRRTGRLDKLIYVGPPDEEARRQMLEHHLATRPVGDDLQVDQLAARLSGYSASDIRFLVDEAAREALKRKSKITSGCFTAAAARVPASVPAEIEASYRAIQQRGT